MKYKTINDLDRHIENIISRTVKHYYTDWKNYDRPYYMKLKGSNRRQDKKLILIARDCGSYLYTIDELYSYYHGRVVCTYYGESVKYYFIDLEKLTCKKAPFAEVEQLIKSIENTINEQNKIA